VGRWQGAAMIRKEDVLNGQITVDKLDIDKELNFNGNSITNVKLNGDLLIGTGTAGDKTIIANNANTNKPSLRYNDTSKKWQFSNDGSTWDDISPVIPGGSNTQVQFNDNGSFGGANVYYDKTTGNVGISMQPPSEKLHVAGNIGISADADAFIGTKDNYALSLRTNNLDRIFIDNVGNVGVGTTSPAYNLDVLGEIHTSNNLYVGGALKVSGDNSFISGKLGIGIPFPSTPLDVNGLIRATALELTGVGNMYDLSVLNYAYLAYSDTSAFVGIGTQSPSEKLDVVGNIKLSGNLLLGNGTAGDKTIIANNADTNKPSLRYNDTSKKWQFSNDGSTWDDITMGVKILTYQEILGLPDKKSGEIFFATDTKHFYGWAGNILVDFGGE
jgi:hypothetical protein